jgi:hypothetical protein
LKLYQISNTLQESSKFLTSIFPLHGKIISSNFFEFSFSNIPALSVDVIFGSRSNHYQINNHFSVKL